MARKNENINLKSFDDLFNPESQKPQEAGERVQKIKLTELHPFKNHPFKVRDDEEMEKTVESVKQYGVLTPAIARPRKEGGFELVSGHRRHYASELVGLNTLPTIVREMDDDVATILMVDSNIQRMNVLPSEKAYAYKLKFEAINRIKGRPKKEGQVVSNYFGKKTSEIIAEDTGESYKQVERYIRLTELIPELLQMVDEKKIAFNPAVELSFLAKEEQEELLDAMDYAQATPSLSQAQRLKKFSKEGNCSLEAMKAIMSEEKKGDLDKVTLKANVLKKYFPKSYTPQQMEAKIISLLEQWQRKRQQQMER